MPTYEFGCQDCGYAFEVIKKMSDQTLPKCTKCASVKVEKLLSVSSFQLKGSGWAHDGYANSSSSVKSDGESSVDRKSE